MPEVSLESLFDSYAVAVRRYLYRRLTHAADPAATADDLTADVFLIAWEKRADIPVTDPLPWLYAVARRVLANQRRRRSDVPVADLGELDAVDESDPAVLVCDDAVLAAAWQQLSARDREVLRLSAWEGLTGEALATALGISAGGAAAALSRARARLTEELSAAEVQETAVS